MVTKLSDCRHFLRATFEAGATTVLFNGDWITVNKSPEADWGRVKSTVKRVLKDAR